MKIQLPKTITVVGIIALFVTVGQFIQCKTTKFDKRAQLDMSGDHGDFDDAIEKNSNDLFEKGKAVFRFETFGDEVFWTDQLQLSRNLYLVRLPNLCSRVILRYLLLLPSLGEV